jgi:hypothetical protein
VAGYAQPALDGNVSLTRLDKNGSVLWSRSIGTDSLDAIEGVTQTADGGFALVGDTYVNDPTTDDMIVVKTNANGVIQWSVSIGGLDYDEAKDVICYS